MLARSGISWRWRARRRARTSCWPGSHPAARPPGRRAPDQSRAAPGRWCRMRRRIPAGCSATARPPSRVVAAGRRSHRRDTPRTAARRTAARPRTRALPRATHRRPPRQAGAPGDAPDPRRPDRERGRSEEHTSELQSRSDLVCRLLLEKKIRQNFTYVLISDAVPEQMRWFNELQRVSCPPQNALKFDDVNSNIDVNDLLEEIDVATLILHAREDAIVPFDQGRLLATQIRGARFVPFEGRNHILLENEPAWPIFLREIRQFQGVSSQDQVFAKQVITDRLPEHELSETKKLIVQTDEIALARFSVVGNYLRYQAEVRNSLKDWKQKIIMGLKSSSNGENYLVWAPPGSGKTYFVQEL